MPLIEQDKLVQRLIDELGNEIILAAPLGVGKPNYLINAIYNAVKKDDNLQLTVCTALTLQRPVGKSDLEKSFINLFEERLFGDYPDLEYELDRVNNTVPSNVRVIEFYFAPGKFLSNSLAQRNYTSTNYTHVMRDVADMGVNLMVQMVAKREIEGKTYYSLSSNPDVSMDLAKKIRRANKPLKVVAQVNQNLPFMYGDSLVSEDYFDYVIDEPDQYYKIFGPPKTAVTDADFMIGLYCSSLVRDDGELQIGIGSLGDATCYGLIMRQENNETYKQIIEELNVDGKFEKAFNQCGDTGKFEVGLFGASEMIVDGFRHLYESKIIKKKVYDHIGLQKAINKGYVKEKFDNDILEVLLNENIISERLTKEDVEFLKHWGIFKPGVQFEDGHIFIDKANSFIPYISEPSNKEFIKDNFLGSTLKGGQVMHGGFFLGPQSFYQWLRELPVEESKLLNMKSVQKINQLYGHEDLDRLHRKNARFINTCMMQTLAGAAVSDGYEDGRVVSGVGGQYNFVAMAQELPDGHSILNLRSTRMKNGKLSSNIVPSYGHITIPRHLRDVVVTEYGIAYIRGKTDEDIIKELLNISDSRFQQELLSVAKGNGKIDRDYEIPDAFKNNYPHSYIEKLKKYKDQGLFPRFPFGTELLDDELKLGKALKSLKADLHSKVKIAKALLKGIMTRPDNKQIKLLKLMNLDETRSLKDRIYKYLVLSKL